MSRLLTTQEFIDRARKVHGYTYSYSLIEYTGAKNEVDIICKDHGVFSQKPNGHLNGNGCKRCARVQSLSTDEFLIKANIIHGSRYDYSLSECESYVHKMTIICRVHGKFYQNYENHLKGMGCRKCGSIAMKRKQRKTKEDFITHSSSIHGGKYDYRLVRYKNQTSKVKIICSKHGEFHQSPCTHTGGSGCPACARTGFDESKNSNVYILISADDKLMKIGITGNFKRRHSELKSSTPFDFRVSEIFPVKGCMARDIERCLHKMSKSASLSGFGGATEWFIYDAFVISKAIAMMGGDVD